MRSRAAGEVERHPCSAARSAHGAHHIRLASHERRLARLVARIEHLLPFDGFPRATAAIEAGCVAYDSSEELRRQLAATPLSDMVGREQLRVLRASFAA